MILIYTGNGKGKTSATVGQALRAHGQGMAVAFGQFMKRPGQAGEQKVCAALFGERFRAGGIGFFRREEERPAQREAALGLLVWAEEQLAGAQMLILDECINALVKGLVLEEEIRFIATRAREENTHLVLSGRGAPPWLMELADTVTEMNEVKHHIAAGIAAAKGIEY